MSAQAQRRATGTGFITAVRGVVYWGCGLLAPWLAPLVALLAIVWFGRSPPTATPAGGLAAGGPEAGVWDDATPSTAWASGLGSAAAAHANLPDAGSVRVADGTSELALDAQDGAVRAAMEYLPDGGFVVDLNLAEEQHLRRLPGIGPGRARAILELRARLGRLRTVDELARIKGIGKSVLRKIRPLVRL